MIPSLQQFLNAIRSPEPRNFSPPNRCWRSFRRRCEPQVPADAETSPCAQALNLTTKNVWNSRKRYTLSIHKGVLVHFGGMVEAAHTETSWNCPTDWCKFQPSASIPPPLWGQKGCREKSAWCKQWRATCPVVSWPIEAGSSSRGHVFGHECSMCQGKPLHTPSWRLRTDSHSILLIWLRCVSHV